MKVNSFFKGASVLAVSTFIAKLIGAMYRIPLTNVLGGEGLGLYQMVFPVYCVLLDFAGAGVPNAISSLVSKSDDSKYNYSLLKTSLKLLSILGIVGLIFMVILAYPISLLQGNVKAWIGYLFLSPAVLGVALISCYRGYFQGKMNMTPTAVSQVIEQVVKAILGVLLVYLLSKNLPLAVGGATFAVTISEIVALIYLYITFKRKEKNLSIISYDKSVFISQAKTLIKTTLPITLIGISIPISQLIDSFLVVNILSTYRNDATALYGLMSGTATTIINLPVALCYGISVATIPIVSRAKDSLTQKQTAKKTLLITFTCSLALAVITFVFSTFATNILFSRLTLGEKTTTSNLIKLLSINVVLLSLLQTQNAVLIGKGKLYSPLLSMGIGIGVKTILSVILLKNQNLNVYGGAISVIACYFVAVLVNFILIKKSGKVNEVNKIANRKGSYA